MEKLSVPWIFVGQSGTGKTKLARQWISEAYNTELTYESRMFNVGDDYSAKVIASAHHFEIDVPNLSMQDKQIMGELLAMFFNSGDVLNSMKYGGRKLVILRRAHSLSLPAAIRVRAIIQEYVLPSNGNGMIWITAREMSGPLAILEDAFVRYRMPKLSFDRWKLLAPTNLQTEYAYEKLEGRLERAQMLVKYIPDATDKDCPRKISDYYDELINAILVGGMKHEPSISTVLYIRARVYDVLAFCQTGPEIIDCTAAALAKFALKNKIKPEAFWKGMDVLAKAEPHTSYRTPLSLEFALLELFEALRNSLIDYVPIKEEVIEYKSHSLKKENDEFTKSKTKPTTKASKDKHKDVLEVVCESEEVISHVKAEKITSSKRKPKTKTSTDE
jgi:hypothetical protein